jgi:CcmD family protein
MAPFATAYLIVWGGTLLYLAMLGARQRRLEAALRRLSASSGSSRHDEEPSRSEAA